VRSSQLSGMIYCTVPPIAYACVFLFDPSGASLHNSVYSMSLFNFVINAKLVPKHRVAKQPILTFASTC
jgi:hypothetical protein